jgi:hypothetical protein
MGNAIFIPFAVLFAQSLFLLIAWVMLVLTILREISVIGDIRIRRRLVHMQAALASNEGVPVPSQAAPGALAISEQSLLTALAQKDRTMRDTARSGILDTSGVLMIPEEKGMHASGEDAQPKNTGIQVVPLSQDDSGRVVAKQESQELLEARNDPAGSAENGPFDVSMAVFELFADPDEPEPNDVATTMQSQAKEEEIIFVYGNPFEGELPEVFHYDKDLQRGVQDLRDALRTKQLALDKEQSEGQGEHKVHQNKKDSDK